MKFHRIFLFGQFGGKGPTLDKYTVLDSQSNFYDVEFSLEFSYKQNLLSLECTFFFDLSYCILVSTIAQKSEIKRIIHSKEIFKKY